MAKKKIKDSPMSIKLSNPLVMTTRQNSKKEGSSMGSKIPKQPSLKSQMKKVRVIKSTPKRKGY